LNPLQQLRRIADPFHFHDGDQDTVIAAPFAQDLEESFREFMTFVQQKMCV